MAEVRLGRDEVENGWLPPVCMRCGNVADTFVSRQFSWRPSGIWLLLFLGLLPYLIVALLLEKRRRVMVPLCAEHKNHWRSRLWWSWGLFVGIVVPAVVSLLLMANNHQLGGLVCSFTLLALLAWAIALIVMQETAIYATEISDVSITLTRVSPRFIEALSEKLEGLRPQPTFNPGPPLEHWSPAPRQVGSDQIQREPDLRAGPNVGSDPRFTRVIECLAHLDSRDRQVQDFHARLSHWQNLDAVAQAHLLRDVEALAGRATAANAIDAFLGRMAAYFKPEVDGCLAIVTFLVVVALGTTLSVSLFGNDYCIGGMGTVVVAILLSVLAHRALRRFMHRRFFRTVFLPQAMDKNIDMPTVLARLRHINAHPAAEGSGQLRDLAAALPRLEEVLCEEGDITDVVRPN